MPCDRAAGKTWISKFLPVRDICVIRRLFPCQDDVTPNQYFWCARHIPPELPWNFPKTMGLRTLRLTERPVEP